jgi:hypothetical protein
MSIRLRLTLWHTALLALVLAGFAALVYVAVSRRLESGVDHDIQVRALQASRELRAVTREWPLSRVRQVDVPTSALVDPNLYVQIVDEDGDVVAGSSNLPEPMPVQLPTLKQALDGQEVQDQIVFRGSPYEVHSAPLLVDGSKVGVLQVAAPLRSLEARLA